MMMLIGGEWAAAAGGGVTGVTNPADLSAAGEVPQGGREDVSAAVDSAAEAFVPWSATPARERGRVLWRAAAAVRDAGDELAALLTREQGKPLTESKGEVLGFANVLEYHASVCGSLHGKTLDLQGMGKGLTLREPLGVCGAIIPWNLPALIMAWKTAPALATGNTVVLKPSSEAPLCCLSLASKLQEAGLPPGVLNVVTGPGAAVGEAIASHPGVRKVSFTGSSGTGKRVAGIAAPTLKRLTLELGGSDPAIVCEDADLERAADGIIAARFYNCGQACTSLKRLYVMEPVADRLISMLKERVSALRVGDGGESGTQMGPLVSLQQQRLMRSFMDDLRSRGGEEASRGVVPDMKGHFFPPTLVTDPPSDARMLDEELFGPILPVVRTSSLDKAMELANGGPYGLGASVWTRDLDTARACAEGFRSGMVWVNMHLRVPVEAPFGGIGDSGMGRENGTESLDSYMEWKTVILG